MMACLVRLGVPLGEGVLMSAVQDRAPLCVMQCLVEHGAAAGYAEVCQVDAAWRGMPPTWAELQISEKRRKKQHGAVEKWFRGLLASRKEAGAEHGGGAATAKGPG